MFEKNKLTKKVMLGVSGVAVMIAMSGCAPTSTNHSKPPVPNNNSCKDWEWSSEDDAYQCDDSSSTHYRSYYHNNAFFASRSALQNDSSYKSYKSNLSSSKNSISSGSKTSSGFGKGTSSGG